MSTMLAVIGQIGAAAADEAPELGSLVLRSLLALGAVVALLYLVLGKVLRRALGPGWTTPGQGRVQVLQRIGLDARHSLVVVRAEQTDLLLGTGEEGLRVLWTMPAASPAAAITTRRTAPAIVPRSPEQETA